MGGVTYTIVRTIVWADAKDASKTYSQAYKSLSVAVTWNDQAGKHTAEQDSLLYPGGLGSYAGAGPVVTTTTAPVFPPASPVLAPINPTNTTADQTQATLFWSQPPGGGTVTAYVVEWSTNPGFPAGQITVSPTQPSTSLTYPAPNLTPATTYYFEVIAYAGSQTATSNAQQFTTAAAGAGCTLGALNVVGATTLSTTGTTLRGNGHLAENLTLSWTTAGPCVDTYEVHGSDPFGSPDPGSPYALIGSAGAYTGLISNNKPWAVGVHTFNVFDLTTGLATPVVKTFKVCTNGVSPC
jgi:hypothetical protein